MSGQVDADTSGWVEMGQLGRWSRVVDGSTWLLEPTSLSLTATRADLSLDESTWLPEPISLDGWTWTQEPICLEESTWPPELTCLEGSTGCRSQYVGMG